MTIIQLPRRAAGEARTIERNRRIDIERNGCLHAGKHGANRSGRLAVRIRQPGVHRRQTGLGSESDKHQEKRKLQ